MEIFPTTGGRYSLDHEKGQLTKVKETPPAAPIAAQKTELEQTPQRGKADANE